MRKKNRIILILFACTLVGGLVIAVSLPGTVAWDRLCWACDDVMIKLGVCPTRRSSPRNACIVNLMQINGAKATWALEKQKSNTDTPTATDLYGTNAYLRDKPTCPRGGNYVIGKVEQKPRCSSQGHTL